MTKKAILPIRLDADIHNRIESAAKRFGFTKSALIRMLIHSFLDELEKNKGKITMPPQWDVSAPASSGRSRLRVAESPAPSYTVKSKSRRKKQTRG